MRHKCGDIVSELWGTRKVLPPYRLSDCNDLEHSFITFSRYNYNTHRVVKAHCCSCSCCHLLSPPLARVLYVLRVHLPTVVVQVSFRASTLVPRQISLVLCVLRVHLPAVVVQVSFRASSLVPRPISCKHITSENVCSLNENGPGLLNRSSDSLCGLDGPGIESLGDFPQPSRPALGPTQPPMQLVPGHFRR
jgi:hypothetical protein